MKLKTTSLAAIASLALAAFSSHAAIVMVAEYHLGETGSLGSSNSPFDSATGGTPSGAQNISSFSGGGTTSVGTVGVIAPGSTACLDTSDAAGNGWYGGDMSTLATDNFGFGIYACAATIGTADVFTLGGSNGSFALSLAANGWAASAKNVAWIGVNDGVSGSFTADQWVHLALIRTGGTTTFYINGVAQGSTYGGVPTQGTIHMSVNPGGGTYFNGLLDEARVVTFDGVDAGAGNINVLNALQSVPEPSAALLGSLGMLALLRRRRS